MDMNDEKYLAINWIFSSNILPLRREVWSHLQNFTEAFWNHMQPITVHFFSMPLNWAQRPLHYCLPVVMVHLTASASNLSAFIFSRFSTAPFCHSRSQFGSNLNEVIRCGCSRINTVVWVEDAGSLIASSLRQVRELSWAILACAAAELRTE